MPPEPPVERDARALEPAGTPCYWPTSPNPFAFSMKTPRRLGSSHKSVLLFLVRCFAYWGLALWGVGRFKQIEEWGTGLTLATLQIAFRAVGQQVHRVGSTLSVAGQVAALDRVAVCALAPPSLTREASGAESVSEKRPGLACYRCARSGPPWHRAVLLGPPRMPAHCYPCPLICYQCARSGPTNSLDTLTRLGPRFLAAGSRSDCAPRCAS